MKLPSNTHGCELIIQKTYTVETLFQLKSILDFLLYNLFSSYITDFLLLCVLPPESWNYSFLAGHILTKTWKKLLNGKNVEILRGYLFCVPLSQRKVPFFCKKCPFIFHSKTRPKLLEYALSLVYSFFFLFFS